MAGPQAGHLPRKAEGLHSLSAVPAGLLIMPRATRLTPGTSLIMRSLVFSGRSYGNLARSTVIASSEVTARPASPAPQSEGPYTLSVHEGWRMRTQRIEVRLEPKTREKLEEVAAARGVTASELVRSLI